MRYYQTFTKSYLQRHHDTHARSPAFGTHEHPYLHDTVRKLAEEVTVDEEHLPSLLDYGCGKGRFLAALRRFGIFGELAGYDPAIPEVEAHPDRQYDLVTCLDVLDQIEPRFIDAVICDVAQFTLGRAVFDVVTQQAKGVNRKTEPVFVWRQRIENRMQVVTTKLHTAPIHEYIAGAFAQRSIIIARPVERSC